MNPRNGKIARLPHEIQEELNQRLALSEQGPQLLAWLNDLKEVKKVVKDDFAGVPINKQNLSEWRQGGFQEWLTRQELWDGVRDAQDFADELGSNRDNVLADDAATVLAARYAALLAKWNGEVDAKFEAKTRALGRVCRSVVQLQQSMHRSKKDNEDFIRGLEEESEKVKAYCKKRLLDQVWAIKREPIVAEYFGGGELGRKLAKYIVALKNDMPNAKLEAITDEDLKKTKQGRRKARPVKPVETEETEPEEVDNPLEESKIEGEDESDSSPDQSDSVKPNQTDLAPEEDEGLGIGNDQCLSTNDQGMTKDE